MPATSVLYRSPRTDPRDVTAPVIPVSWFSDHHYMSPGQALALYLVDVIGLNFTDAGDLIKKDETTVRRAAGIGSQKRAKHEAALAAKKRKRKTKEAPTNDPKQNAKM